MVSADKSAPQKLYQQYYQILILIQEFIVHSHRAIKNQVVDHPETYNKDQVVASANAIAAVANSGLGALFGPGTDQATGWKKTRLKAEFFEKPEDVKKLALAFNKEANELARVAATGDKDAIKTQFGKVGETCKNCHDQFRSKE